MSTTYFPDISNITNNITPLDGQVLIQVMSAGIVSSTIQLLNSTTEDEGYQRNLSKVISMGDHAFYDKSTGNKWVNINPGDFIIAPSIHGKRFTVNHPSGNGSIHLLVISDVHCQVKIKDPDVYLNSLTKQII